MERLPKLDVKAYVTATQADFEKTMRSVVEAVNRVPEGHVINASAEKVRNVLT